MILTIKGKKIKNIRTLVMTCDYSDETCKSKAHFVVYDDYKEPNDAEPTTNILYFNFEDLESIELP